MESFVYPFCNAWNYTVMALCGIILNVLNKDISVIHAQEIHLGHVARVVGRYCISVSS